MAAQTCTFLTDTNAEKGRICLGTEPFCLILTFGDKSIFKKFRFSLENTVTITDYTERAVAISSRTSS